MKIRYRLLVGAACGIFGNVPKLAWDKGVATQITLNYGLDKIGFPTIQYSSMAGNLALGTINKEKGAK